MYSKKPQPGKPKGKGKKKPMMSQKGPMDSMGKKPQKNRQQLYGGRMPYGHGGEVMPKAKPC